MREIDARVTGFDYTTYHAYTTEVEVDGRAWTLGIRYNTFYQFYTRLAALEKHFTVDFPPKGGLFFSPPPEERQEQLDDFLLSTLAYFDMRGHPRRMEALLGELLQIPEHLDVKDDEERTASEGSSVAEELLLDGLSTPMPGHDDDHDDFLESGLEDDDHDVQEDDRSARQGVNNQVEAVDLEVDQEHKAEAVHDDHQENQQVVAPVAEAVEAELETKPEVAEAKLEEEQVLSFPKTELESKPVQEQRGRKLTGGAVAKDYLAMLRRRTLVEGAIQAAVVSTMKENVEKSKVAKVEQDVKVKKPVEEEKELKVDEAVKVEEALEQETPISELDEQPAAPVVEEKPTAPKAPVVQAEATPAKPATESVVEAPVSVLEVPKVVTTAPEEEAVEALGPVVASADSPSEPEMEETPVETPVTETEQDTVAEVSAPASVSETEAAEQAAATPAESVQVDESSSDEESEEATLEPSKKEAASENAVVSWFRRMGTFGPSAEQEEQEAADIARKEQEAVERAAAEARQQEEQEATTRAEAEARAKAEEDTKAEAAEAELLRAEQEVNLRLKLYRHPVFFQGFNCDVGTSRYSLPQRLSDGIIV